MTFGEAISACFRKYASFDGRAARSEFWWFILFILLASAAAGIVSEALSGLFSLAVLLPSLAVGARRLHDVDKSAWLLLLWLVPVIGWIILLIWALQPAKEPNRYGTASSAD